LRNVAAATLLGGATLAAWTIQGWRKDTVIADLRLAAAQADEAAALTLARATDEARQREQDAAKAQQDRANQLIKERDDTHWHMLLFVRATGKYKTEHVTDIASRAVRIMKRYAWRVDRGEPGAFKRRLDVKKIDWSKGSAAGYIAKYVAKNIDGVADHKTKEGHIVAAENLGEVELVPSARVEAWAAAWGIRQFQQ